MGAYHVPGTTIAQTSGNRDIKKFDTKGHAVLDVEEFRVFESQDGTYPIAYRADTRPSTVIFRDGFRRRRNADAKFPRPGCEPPIASWQQPTVAIRLANKDMDTDCAVCVTRKFEMAALFPFNPRINFGTRTSNIFICRMRQWFETYSLQHHMAPHLADAQEVASLGIGPGDVVGCYRVNASWQTKGVSFSLLDYVRNDEYDNQLEAIDLGTAIKADYASESKRAVIAPGFQDEKAYGLVHGKEVFKALEAILPSLRGNADTNRVEEYVIGDLKASVPTRSQHKRRSSFDLGSKSSKNFG